MDPSGIVKVGQCFQTEGESQTIHFSSSKDQELSFPKSEAGGRFGFLSVLSLFCLLLAVLDRGGSLMYDSSMSVRSLLKLTHHPY